VRYTDIAIIGGGLAGSTAAAMLGRAGIPTLMIDPHETYPFDFRAEKLSGDSQLGRFERTGLAEPVLRTATHDGENWIARFGYLLHKSPSREYGIMYDALIMAIRAEITAPAERLYAKVTDVSTSAERQKLTLSDGETISARLVVLANGLNVGLRRNLGIERQIISACHSISIGFDLVPVGRPAFDFPALTYFSERVSDRIPYLYSRSAAGCGPIFSPTARSTTPG
jgi:2-polyprenyl-6-methoxyphenol hydroxylase-like FAD-dependent oxidoreductase